MTASIVEVKTADVGSGVSSSIPLATTLEANDLVVVVSSRYHTNAINISINGGPFDLIGSWQGNTGTFMFVHTKTGLTGSQSVSYVTDVSINHFTVYVVRGLSDPSAAVFAISTWGTGSTTANTDEGPAALSVGVGQVAVFAAVASGGTLTFPSNPTPATGWTVDRADAAGNGSHLAAHHVVAAPGTVQANIRSSLTRILGTVMVVFGDVESTPPLESTFIGWGEPIF